MEARVDKLETAVEKLEETLEKANKSEEKLMCQYDTMSQLFFEKEKVYLEKMDESEKRHLEEKASMRKHYQRIIVSISLVLLLIVGSLIGGLIYLISNYDVAFEVYQDVSAEGGGDSTVEDGIHLNGTPIDTTPAQ